MIFFLVLIQQVIIWFAIREILKRSPVEEDDFAIAVGVQLFCLIPFVGLMVCLLFGGSLFSEITTTERKELILKYIYNIKDRK